MAIAALALYSALPVAAQTTVTMEAESMTLSSYAVENGNRIKLTAATGTASKSFSGPSGTYNMQVFVVAEPDGQSTLQVFKGATQLKQFTYPLSNSVASFAINNVALSSGDTIKLVGRANAGALARVDRIVLTQVAAATTAPTSGTTTTTTPPTGGTTTTTTGGTTTTGTTTTGSTTTTTPIIGGALGSVAPVTLEAEAMTLSSYAVENGRQIKLTSSTVPGTASKSFPGLSGTYSMHVYVLPETDGRSTLEVWKGATRLTTYTYPLSASATTFTISNVALNSGDMIKLVGRANAGALARVDKVVLTPVSASTTPPTSGGTTTPPTGGGDTTPTTTPPVLTLPSTNTSAVATFESVGLYWKPPANPGAAGCTVQYRRSGDSAWKQGLAMWYDSRNGECRGSLVYLTPGTDYQVQFSLPGQQPSAQLATKTWSENFPIARVVTLPNGTSGATLNITQGGTADGYVLYTSPSGGQSTIDVANGSANNVTVSAPYVIVRGLVLKGAQADAIRLLQGAHDVVIEDNDISGWGRFRTTLPDGQQAGMDLDAAVRAVRLTGLQRVIVQRNKIHDPRYGANSWAYGHPQGPQGIGFMESPGGNHVFRYNEITSSEGHYYNDGMGEGENFSTVGFPHADTDIYGNVITHCWDDAIESEGGNRNVRVWGNYMDHTLSGVATTATQTGPIYIFRNVQSRSRFSSLVSTDDDMAGQFAKAGTSASFGNGRRYLFHNTTLQATAAGSSLPLGIANGINGPDLGVTNTVSRNNIWEVKRPARSSIAQATSTNNDFDYDLFNGGLTTYAGAERNGMLGTPIYQSGSGWTSESNGMYQLAPNSRGYDAGVRIPNFNDSYTGAGPDVGAAEAGRPAMRFGLKAATPSSFTSDGAAPRGAGDL